MQRKKRGSCRERRGLCPLQESLKIDLLEGRASCEALPVNDRLNYLSSFVNKRMAAYTIAKITTQMNHFMLSPPFFLKFWEETQNLLSKCTRLAVAFIVENNVIGNPDKQDNQGKRK